LNVEEHLERERENTANRIWYAEFNSETIRKAGNIQSRRIYTLDFVGFVLEAKTIPTSEIKVFAETDKEEDYGSSKVSCKKNGRLKARNKGKIGLRFFFDTKNQRKERWDRCAVGNKNFEARKENSFLYIVSLGAPLHASAFGACAIQQAILFDVALAWWW